MSMAPAIGRSATDAAPFQGGDCEKYCVFQLRRSTIAVLADAVREVALRPAIASVPRSDLLLAGLTHLRNEFIPVIRLEPRAGNATDGDAHILVLNANDGPWAMLVDRVLGLVPLEVSMCGDGGALTGWSSAVMGSATHENRIIQVLDVQALRRYVGDSLACCWRAANFNTTQSVRSPADPAVH